METPQRLAWAVLLLSLTVFIALFGRLPAFRSTPIGQVHRKCGQALTLIVKMDAILTGGKIAINLSRFGDYIMYTNHPLVMIFFIVVLFSSQIIFLSAAMASMTVSQLLISFSLCIGPYYLLAQAVTNKSSVVSVDTHRREMERYPCDQIIFHGGNICPTCQREKPARSKHCGICKTCVSKHDHHCAWVRNCLGRSNYRYFLALLVNLGLLLNYGTFIAFTLCRGPVQQYYAQQNQLGAQSWSEFWDVWAWSFSQDIRVGAVGLLACLTGPLAWGLFVYHVYLIYAGMTTNESAKWADLRDDIACGLVYRRTLPPNTSRPPSNWPIQSTQETRICLDGKSPSVARFSIQGNDISEPWIRVQSLAEVENLYDLGFWDNLCAVFYGT